MGAIITLIGMGIMMIFIIIVALEGSIESYIQAVKDRDWDFVIGVGGLVLGVIMMITGVLIAGCGG